MAITLPVYQQTVAAQAVAGGSGAETVSPVALLLDGVFHDTVRRGALVGLGLKHTTNAGGSELVVIRIYRGAAKTDLIMEVAVTFTSANDYAYVQPDLPIPFFSGLWASAESTTGVGGTGNAETVEVKPDILSIAGNS